MLTCSKRERKTCQRAHFLSFFISSSHFLFLFSFADVFPSPGPDDCRKYPKNCFCFLFMPASIEKSSCVIKNILWELIVLIIFIFILIVQCYIVCVLLRMREERRCNEEHKCDGRLHVKILHVQLSVGISLSHSTDMGLLLLNGFYGEIPSSPFGHLLSHPLPKKM